MTLEAGTTIGRYEILGLIGQGGMASVYKARQPALDRVVAIKVLRPSLAEDPEFRERFEREARAAGQLRHPRIVEVFDFDVVDGRYFMAMEHVEGATLKDRLSDLARQQKSPPPREIARIVSEVAEGLAFAHENGVIHRDVKPSNIMLRTDGRALVADFGIAKMASTTQYTRTGTGIGTPEYMSPEQAQGLQVGPASDIYALAVVAYEIFTGRVPFTAESPLAIALSHIRDQVPVPSAISPLVGPAIEEVLLRGLAKAPEERYASTVEFAAALAAAVVADESTTFATLPRLAEREGSLRPTSSLRRRIRRRRGQLLILAGGVLVTVSIAGLVLSTAPTAVPTAATLRVLDGSPELLARGQPRYDVAVTGSVVGPGDKLRMLGSARVEMSFFDGSVLVLEPGTEVELSRADRSADGIASVRVQQKVGLTRASVIAPTRFAVETPTALVQAHGTEFAIDVAADGTTGVVVTDSEVRVTAQGRTVAVRSGDRASVKPGRPPEGGTAVTSGPQFPVPVPEIALPQFFQSSPSLSPTPTPSPPASASATASASPAIPTASTATPTATATIEPTTASPSATATALPPTASPTLVVPSPTIQATLPPTTVALRNGDFAKGLDGWTPVTLKSGGSAWGPYFGSPSVFGSQAASIEVALGADGYIEQEVPVPLGAYDLELRVGRGSRRVTISVAIDAGGVETTLDRFTPGCVAGQATRAEEKRYPLTGYGGQTIKLRLGSTSLGFAGDSFAYFDDVAIQPAPADGRRRPLNALGAGDDHSDCAVGATPVRAGETARGEIGRADDVDFFNLFTEPVYFYKIQLRAQDWVPRLTVRDNLGATRSILTTEDGADTGSLSPTNVPSTYAIDVRGQGPGQKGTYSIVVTAILPVDATAPPVTIATPAPIPTVVPTVLPTVVPVPSLSASPSPSPSASAAPGPTPTPSPTPALAVVSVGCPSSVQANQFFQCTPTVAGTPTTYSVNFTNSSGGDGPSSGSGVWSTPFSFGGTFGSSGTVTVNLTVCSGNICAGGQQVFTVTPAPTPTPSPTPTATLLWSENFDSYASGSFPSATGWQLWYSGSIQEVSSLASSTAPNALRLRGPAHVARAIPGGLGVVTLKGRFMAPQVSPGPGQVVGLSLGYSAGGGSFPRVGACGIEGDGNLNCDTGLVAAAQANHWYTIHMVIDLVSHTVRVWVDGAYVGQATVSGNPTAVILAAGNSGLQGYVDDVFVYNGEVLP